MLIELRKLKVLYIEDHEFERFGLDEYLKNIVKKVYLGANGQQGLELYKKYSPDIILTDIKMPVMDGFEMISKIRKNNQKIPIILITANYDVHYIKKIKDLGVYKVINKPVDYKKLNLILNSCIQIDCIQFSSLIKIFLPSF